MEKEKEMEFKEKVKGEVKVLESAGYSVQVGNKSRLFYRREKHAPNVLRQHSTSGP